MFWSKKVEYLELFQLENLILNQTQFHFFFLRNSDSRELPKILLSASTTSAEDLKAKALAQNFSKQEPIVLVCEDGIESTRVAKWLMSRDFINVYVLENGVQSLSQKL